MDTQLQLQKFQRLPPLDSSRGSSADKNPKYRYSPVQIPFKSGPSYILGGIKHALPSADTLKPHIDTKSGTLDTWPAHTTGSSGTRLVTLSKNKQLVVIDEEKLGKPQIKPKPKLLGDMESYLKLKLRTIGVSQVEPSELRLQVYREVFDYLMDEFKTFKPLLQAIKREYELMLTHNRESIRRLEPLKQMLITTTEKCQRKIDEIKNTDKPALMQLKQKKQQLEMVINNLQYEQMDLKSEVEQLQLQLAQQYLHYRDQADARKLLVIDINELRYRQEDLRLQEQAASQYQSGEDPTTIKIALRRALKDEKRAREHLESLLQKHANETPRRDFELLEKRMATLQEQFELKSKDTDTLKSEHEVLQQVHEQVLKQRDDFFAEVERLKRTSTPRPDWDRCADVIQGGMARWQTLSQGVSSNDRVKTLLKELERLSQGDLGTAEYFEGQGTGPEVPAYLRFEGQVRNRHLGKRETSLLITDIWKQRIEDNKRFADGAQRPLLSEFLVTYLEERYPLKQMVTEWSYNIHDACQRFSHDEQIAIFLGVLSQEIDEKVYHNQLETISLIFGHLKKYIEPETAEGQQQTGLTKDIFRMALTEFYEEKTDSEIEHFVAAAEQELQLSEEADIIEFNNLFIEDEEGKFGPFVNEIKRGLEEDKVSYVSDILKEIQSETVEVEELQRAVTLTDPEIDTDRLDKLLLWAFKVTERAELDMASAANTADIRQRLVNGDIQRVGLKPDM